MILRWQDLARTKKKDEDHHYRMIDLKPFRIVLHEYGSGWQTEWHEHEASQLSFVLEGEMVVDTGEEVVKHEAGQGLYFSGWSGHQNSSPSRETVALSLYFRPQRAEDREATGS